MTRLRPLPRNAIAVLSLMTALLAAPRPAAAGPDGDLRAAPVRVELVAPSGQDWVWGPDDAVDTVAGPAEDFCLVVTQRRHPAATSLRVEGPAAIEWMGIAQAFAGGAGSGRTPGQFPPLL